MNVVIITGSQKSKLLNISSFNWQISSLKRKFHYLKLIARTINQTKQILVYRLDYIYH